MVNTNLVLMVGENEPNNLFQPILVQINDNTLSFIKDHIQKDIEKSYSSLSTEKKALAKSINSKLQSHDTLVKLIADSNFYIEEVSLLNCN